MWEDYIRDVELDQLAILYVFERGLLVRIREIQNGKFITQHVRLLNMVDFGACKLEVHGDWLVNSQWCIS